MSSKQGSYYLNFAFDQRESEVNLHKATSSPSNVSPASKNKFVLNKIALNKQLIS
jgi:hypothetical protein